MTPGNIKVHVIAACLVHGISIAQAAELVTKFSGFGTVGAVKTNSDEADFTRSPIQYNGASKDLDFGVDSRLGLQGTVLYDKFSVTGQILTQRLANSDVRPRVEWLFANYAVTDWFDVRAGRMVLPLFALSDSRNVGYSSVWLRAPQEVYSLYPVTGVDGVQAIMRIPLGGTILTLQPSYGHTSGSYSLSTLDATINLKLRKLTSLLVNWEVGDWTLHVAKSTTELSSHLVGAPFFIPPDGFTDESMTNYGVSYDNGRGVFQAEYAKRTQNPGGYENEGYYAMAGWRFGKVTPYYVYGHYKPNAAVAGVINGSSNALGIRYDAVKNVAFKAQIERRAPVNLFFNHLQNPFAFEQTSGKINALSLAVDFIF